MRLSTFFTLIGLVLLFISLLIQVGSIDNQPVSPTAFLVVLILNVVSLPLIGSAHLIRQFMPADDYDDLCELTDDQLAQEASSLDAQFSQIRGEQNRRATLVAKPAQANG